MTHDVSSGTLNVTQSSKYYNLLILVNKTFETFEKLQTKQPV